MSMPPSTTRYIAFAQGKRIAQGFQADLSEQLTRAAVPALVFNLTTGEQVELPGGSTVAALANDSPGRPGRPKLGVVAREVTLLPQDWEWLGQQPGGASSALRKLVLAARRSNAGADRVRQAQLICYRFISAIAGDEAGFEEATRALYAGREQDFSAHIQSWPDDIRDHARALAAVAFAAFDRLPRSPTNTD
jgi:uncharacterized protein